MAKRSGCAPVPVMERFWPKVDRSDPDGCWLWTGSTSSGYGQMSSRHGHPPLAAHRVAYENLVGPIAPGLHVCHHCDTPACVRPGHLFLGTPAENLADMRAKGRGSPPPRNDQTGERGSNAKLTWAAVAEIRGLAAQGVMQKALARQFRVSDATISEVVRGRRWKEGE
jgi:hypothetical protein